MRSMSSPHPVPTTLAQARLQQIERARLAVMSEGRSVTDSMVDAWFDRAWIERSWRRCLAQGQQPDQPVTFEQIPVQARRRVQEANHALVAAARPVLDRWAGPLPTPATSPS
jgi:transcriptional regulator of acetoin/glycerol metabolism